METSSSIFSSSSPALALILAMVLVLLAHVAIDHASGLWAFMYERSLPSRDDAFRVEANLKLLPGDNGGKRVFLMGSSQTREDFDVAYLNRRFFGQATFFNLGFSGNGNPIEMNMLLPKVLAQRPDLVAYMPFIGSLFRPYTYSTFDLYFHPSSLSMIHELYGWPELVTRADVITMGLLRYSSVVFRHRGTVQHMTNDAVARFIHHRPLPHFRTFAYHARKPEAHFRRRIAAHRNRPRYREHRYRTFYETSFRQMVERLSSAGVPLLVIDGPTHPLIKKVYDPELDQRYVRFMEEMSAETGFTRLGKADLPEFAVEEFTDFTHLFADGRARFNSFFGDWIDDNLLRSKPEVKRL